VAIVDTGIDFNHPDLTVAAACFTAYTSCQDDHGHGTHVAGIVAARNNTQDVVGVAPDATLYAVKVLDQGGSGTDSAIIAGLDWIRANAPSLNPQIRVVNMSLGRPGSLDDNPVLRSAVKALHDGDATNGIAPITVVVATGNDAASEVSQQVPATYPEVLAVASTTASDGAIGCTQIKRDTASSFTTDGKFDVITRIGVTISAPGEQQEDVSKGCLIRSVGILSTRLGGGTTRMSGTSMASPHVAGVVARMWDKADDVAGGILAPETARDKIRASAAAPGSAPLNSPTRSYTFDGEREGVVSVVGALSEP
jgi:subtilisin family serine protease